MPNVTSHPSGNPVVGELIVLEDELAETRVVLALARGGLVTSFQVRGRELLYIDETTLNDGSKNVRGGIPVLFPSPGKLSDESYATDGKRFSMKQHGFARSLPWALESTLVEPVASVTIGLVSNAATLAQYPWAFGAKMTFSVAGKRLRIAFRVENSSPTEMPYALGFHPYFLVRDKASARIDTSATRAFDNVTKKTEPFRGFDLTRTEVDLHLVDHGSSEITLTADSARIFVRGSPEFTRWVVWTLGGKPFVCLEPWTAPGDALNTGEHLLRIAPGGSHESWIELGME